MILNILLISFIVLLVSATRADIFTAEKKCSRSVGDTKTVYTEGLQIYYFFDSVYCVNKSQFDFEFYLRVQFDPESCAGRVSIVRSMRREVLWLPCSDDN